MILSVKPDGSYRWQCDDCCAERNEYPHRGPRNSLCKRCQNIRYRAGRPPAQGRVRAHWRGATGPTGSAAGKAAGGRGEVSAPGRPGPIPPPSPALRAAQWVAAKTLARAVTAGAAMVHPCSPRTGPQ